MVLGINFNFLDKGTEGEERPINIKTPPAEKLSDGEKGKVTIGHPEFDPKSFAESAKAQIETARDRNVKAGVNTLSADQLPDREKTVVNDPTSLAWQIQDARRVLAAEAETNGSGGKTVVSEIAKAVSRPEAVKKISGGSIEESSFPGPSIEIPATISTVVEKNPNLSEISQESEAINNIKEISERKYIFLFLKEINDLLEKGKELEKTTDERNSNAASSQEYETNNSALRSSAEQIRATISAFLNANDEETLRNELQNTLTSFQKYLTMFEDKVATVQMDARKVDNILLTKINAKKTEINSLLKSIGGPINFEKIKKGIRDAERIGAIAKSEAKKAGVKETTIVEINTNCVKVVSEDFNGTKIILESNSETKVVDLLIHIFGNKN